MTKDNEGKRMKLEELTSVICTSLIKSKSCLNKSSDKVNYTDKTELKQSSALLSDHLVSVQQEFNKWISLHRVKTMDSTVTKGQTAMPNMAGDITKKAYDKETFASLMECCSRLFFCDEEIVIIDLFLATEKAISEKDLEDELGLSDNRLREHLFRLEKQGILKRFSSSTVTNILNKPQKTYKKDTREAASSHSYWRINNHVILAIHYKLTRMEEVLQQRLKGLHESDKFVCPKCEETYDSLTVQTLEMDGFDAHFICKCGTKVELDDKSTKEDIYSSQQRRFQDQVKTLKKCLYDAWGMDVPEFPTFTRKQEKSAEAGNLESSSVVGDSSSMVGGESSVASGGSELQYKTAGHTVSDSGRPESSALAGRTDNRKIKFHMKVTPKDPSPSSIAQRPKTMTQKPQEAENTQHTKSWEKKHEEPVPDFYISKLNKTVSLMGKLESAQKRI
ncbi:transcription factor TFIIE [Theileria orientalis strain Shintoku]|uniref:Transcription factor TFIIE n=1 Tax=Theileria orientalis strain Shintoku TaxID=869250 RepID=J4CCK7_THEOR|nr:transcription factor TFIIE [Theileria orientalis strain Shintoku]BAM39562.1 transcription factor TFIIE [Theileria orientalis strain Shintoku]|eukprot:XP_009689863.1 transcription factor TFIIE [Theileria orientalis strain Shintoku]